MSELAFFWKHERIKVISIKYSEKPFNINHQKKFNMSYHFVKKNCFTYENEFLWASITVIFGYLNISHFRLPLSAREKGNKFEITF